MMLRWGGEGKDGMARGGEIYPFTAGLFFAGRHTSAACRTRPQEGHSQVLELLAAVTRDGAISNTFDPMSRVRLGGGGRGMGRKLEEMRRPRYGGTYGTIVSQVLPVG